jgi:hypothetical protein
VGFIVAADISNSGCIVGNELLDDNKGYRFHDGVLSYVPNTAYGETKQEIYGVNEHVRAANSV